MINRRPLAPNDGDLIPDFAPVPVRYRHDGWTPERQRAFIAALADTGTVTRAAAMVNMSLEGCYTLRRHPGAEGFRRAWEAALDFGVARLRDIAFERAVEGELIPVFVGGKLMGFRRKHNDRLLMFCLRHYGRDDSGKRTTINYFSTRATAGASGAAAAAEASTTTCRTVIHGAAEPRSEGDDATARVIEDFAGVAIDAEGAREIEAAIAAAAARRRAADDAMETGGEAGIAAAIDEPREAFVPVAETGNPYWGTLKPPVAFEEVALFGSDEAHWSLAGAEKPDWVKALTPADLLAAPDVPEVRRRKRKSNWDKRKPGAGQSDAGQSDMGNESG